MSRRVAANVPRVLALLKALSSRLGTVSREILAIEEALVGARPRARAIVRRAARRGRDRRPPRHPGSEAVAGGRRRSARQGATHAWDEVV